MIRRPLLAIALLSVILHGVGIARSPLPAQDGLKFLRIARDFHRKPWVEVVRGSDQHPLYPASIAILQPAVACVSGDTAESWRISAQLVSSFASVSTLIALFLLVARLFDPTKSTMACLLFVLLPLPTSIGHETLSDSLALFFVASSLAFGIAAFSSRKLTHAIGCGAMAGLGYLTRPEVAIVPVSIILGFGLRFLSQFASSRDRQSRVLQLTSLSLIFLCFVGTYALVKGEVSEKLALRRTALIRSIHDTPQKSSRVMPPGLDDPRLDFSAKEESDAPGPTGWRAATVLLMSRWAESLGLILLPFALIGAWRERTRPNARLLMLYVALFSVVLVRHVTTFGYLSSRHVLSLMLVSLPFSASAIMDAVQWVKLKREQRWPGSVERTSYLRVLSIGAMLVLALSVQFHRPPHQSRWGHGQAGRWLASHARATQSVLDTRGWASFVSGRTGHDYWHVRQALNDPNLSFVVVGEDELTASSKRAETLRTVLAFAAEPVAEFPEGRGGRKLGVMVFAFHPPSDWRGMLP